jgi:hypothetical protein
LAPKRSTRIAIIRTKSGPAKFKMVPATILHILEPPQPVQTNKTAACCGSLSCDTLVDSPHVLDLAASNIVRHLLTLAISQRTMTRLLPAIIATAVAIGHLATAHEIGIERKFSSNDCVSGYLLVDGTPVCYVLELPWQNNAPFVSSIPAGSYQAFIRNDGPKGWRIQLVDVPLRDNVQIHIGNKPTDSWGCLLPGKSIAPDLCHVFGSADAMGLIKTALTSFPRLDSDSKIVVTISDGGGSDSGRVF